MIIKGFKEKVIPESFSLTTASFSGYISLLLLNLIFTTQVPWSLTIPVHPFHDLICCLTPSPNSRLIWTASAHTSAWMLSYPGFPQKAKPEAQVSVLSSLSGATIPGKWGYRKVLGRRSRVSQWDANTVSSPVHVYFHFVWAPNSLLCAMCGLNMKHSTVRWLLPEVV